MGALVAESKTAGDCGGCSGGAWQATRDQERQIELELAKNQPLVSEQQPLWSLVEEYCSEQAAVYRQKAVQLHQKYATIRRVRGDGNCFYRAFAFACLERIASEKAKLDRFCLVTASWKERLIKLGFSAMTTEDFHDTFMELLSEVDKGMTMEELIARFNVQCNSDYVVAFMRLVTAGYLLENSDSFQAFIDGDRSLKDYCEQEVEPMGRKCDHVCIAALTKALGKL
ncbi:unnamed protein product [Soboliphyme baturini]|uniref:ubiquitinyl hydrolase 1 n=1 Tax=Soboliphyme baturini TaxID=241478 RepID=A0A183J5F0_9BILA|nr:unnamed protein product [Soboliphyme baturini]